MMHANSEKKSTARLLQQSSLNSQCIEDTFKDRRGVGRPRRIARATKRTPTNFWNLHQQRICRLLQDSERAVPKRKATTNGLNCYGLIIEAVSAELWHFITLALKLKSGADIFRQCRSHLVLAIADPGGKQLTFYQPQCVILPPYQEVGPPGIGTPQLPDPPQTPGS